MYPPVHYCGTHHWVFLRNRVFQQPPVSFNGNVDIEHLKVVEQPPAEWQSKPGFKAAATFYGWGCLLLTYSYPGVLSKWLSCSFGLPKLSPALRPGAGRSPQSSCATARSCVTAKESSPAISQQLDPSLWKNQWFAGVCFWISLWGASKWIRHVYKTLTSCVGSQWRWIWTICISLSGKGERLLLQSLSTCAILDLVQRPVTCFNQVAALAPRANTLPRCLGTSKKCLLELANTSHTTGFALCHPRPPSSLNSTGRMMRARKPREGRQTAGRKWSPILAFHAAPPSAGALPPPGKAANESASCPPSTPPILVPPAGHSWHFNRNSNSSPSQSFLLRVHSNHTASLKLSICLRWGDNWSTSTLGESLRLTTSHLHFYRQKQAEQNSGCVKPSSSLTGLPSDPLLKVHFF